jgi:exoribonuclease-2
MSTVAAPHQGLGVAQYMWSSSPLRRYVDLLNQRQIVAMLHEGEPAYPKNDPALYAAMRDFDTMYAIYNDFQRSMERYWCLRWLQQEQGVGAMHESPGRERAIDRTTSHSTSQSNNDGQVAGYHASPLPELVVTAIVLRENLVKLSDIPLIFKVPSLPELSANTRVQLTIGEIDLLDLEVRARFVAAVSEDTEE